MRAALTLVAGLTLSASAAQLLAAPSRNTQREAHFTCADGTALDVTFKGYRADVTQNGKTVQLAQVRVASGFWYQDNRHNLRGKGDEVQWTAGGAAATTCKAAS